jgi:hypothetical protein
LICSGVDSVKGLVNNREPGVTNGSIYSGVDSARGLVNNREPGGANGLISGV